MAKFPTANYIDCPSPLDCISYLKQNKCQLYADDELMLKYRALNDPTLEVTGEQFNTQYIVWPIRYDLDIEKSRLLKKWMYASVANATLDLLDYKYFSVKLCPLGQAGENCDKNCDPKHGTSDRVGKCVCKSSKWMGDDCSTEVVEELNLYPNWEIAMCYVFFGINALACLVCGGWIYANRDSKQVKAWQPFFLNLVLVGCLISSSSIITLVQQNDSDEPVYACAVFPWLYTVGFSITFGTLYAKILRVYKLFQAAADTRRITVTQTETLKWVGFITLVDIIIVAVWTGVDPLAWTRVIVSTDIFGEPLESVGYCTSTSWKIFVSLITCWHLLLLLRACFLCYQTRHISTKFAESRYLAVAMVSHLQIFAISIPILVIVGDDPTASLFIRSAVIFINDFAIMLIIFGTLMYSVHFKGGDDVTVGSAIRIYTQSRASTAERRSLGGRRSTFGSAVSSAESGPQSQIGHRKSIGSVDSQEDEIRRSIRAVQLEEEENNNDKVNKVSFTDSTMKLQALKLNQFSLKGKLLGLGCNNCLYVCQKIA